MSNKIKTISVVVALSILPSQGLSHELKEPVSIVGDAPTIFMPERLFSHDRSYTDSKGRLLISADYEPAYKQLQGLLPKEWELLFASDKIAITPIAWGVGDRWVDVLDDFGKTNHVNLMADSSTKKIIASPEQTRRPAGITFVNSENKLHEQLYDIKNTYNDSLEAIAQRHYALTGTTLDHVRAIQLQARLHDAVQLRERLVLDSERIEQEALDKEDAVARVLAGTFDSGHSAGWVEQRGQLTIRHTGEMSYFLKAGPLKEQVVQMLIDGGRVASGQHVVWQVSSNHMWMNDFLVSGESFDHLLGRVLQTYRMAVIYQANNVAVIRYIERS